MSAQQGNNNVNNQFATNQDTVPNRRVVDNFSSSRSYAPECKFYIHIFFFKKKTKLIINYIYFTMNEKPEAFITH